MKPQRRRLSAHERWKMFTKKDRAKCAKKGYECLIDGTYWYDGKRYRCGCE